MLLTEIGLTQRGFLKRGYPQVIYYFWILSRTNHPFLDTSFQKTTIINSCWLGSFLSSLIHLSSAQWRRRTKHLKNCVLGHTPFKYPLEMLLTTYHITAQSYRRKSIQYLNQFQITSKNLGSNQLLPIFWKSNMSRQDHRSLSALPFAATKDGHCFICQASAQRFQLLWSSDSQPKKYWIEVDCMSTRLPYGRVSLSYLFRRV